MPNSIPHENPNSQLNKTNQIENDGNWFLYLLECKNGHYYAGITNDLAARFNAHKSGKGAKYTRANPPVRIIAHCSFANRSLASRAEWAVKQLPREKKAAFVTKAGSVTPKPARIRPELHR